MMETSSVGEVTSTETHRFVFLARMIEMSRFARRFSVFDASDSYEAIETQGVVTGGQHTNSIKFLLAAINIYKHVSQTKV